MSSVTLELEDEVAALLQQSNRPVGEAARELIVLELYRRGALSSGKAAESLGMKRFAFVDYAARLGIPYLDMTDDEWATERARSQNL
jgi:predicted HTH domain antitoxin